MQYFSWGKRSTYFSFFLVATFPLKKKKNLEFECRRVISFIFISCDGMNNVELVILFVILRLIHEKHNWKLLSTIARLVDGWMLDMHGS